MDPDPDPGGPKTRGSGSGFGSGFGSGSATLGGAGIEPGPLKLTTRRVAKTKLRMFHTPSIGEISSSWPNFVLGTANFRALIVKLIRFFFQNKYSSFNFLAN
jgi:hypothetical protein